MLKFDLQTFAEPAEGNEPINEPATEEHGNDAPPEPVNQEEHQEEPAVEVNFDSVKLPDGWEMDDSFKSAVKDLGLNQDGAQKFVDYIKTGVVDSIKGEQAKAREELLSNWEKTSHTEFSDDEIESAKLAYKNLADDELKELMDKTGLGSNPAMIRMFAKLGKMTGEGKLVIGNAHDKLSAAERMFSKSMGVK